MKKSEKIRCAMIAVVNSSLDTSVKLEVLELLLDDTRLALWSEEQEAKMEQNA